MTDQPMTPIPIPPEAAAARPDFRALAIGPPPGVSDDECGTVGALVGVLSGYPAFADYWRPTADQLEILQRGGFLELIQYAPRMIMHSLTVWDVPAVVEGCSWIDCQVEGEHQHEQGRTRWTRTAGEHVEVDVDRRGCVTISATALGLLMAQAGWERAK